MEVFKWKTRMAILWLIMAVAYSAHMALSIFEPGVIQLVTNGGIKISEGEFIFSALFAWLIPIAMAFLSMTLKDPVNRRANIILGIVFTIGNIFHLSIEQLTRPSIHMAQPSIHQLLLNLFTVVATALIAWFAWKWPKVE
jgi:hypothetical protein